MTTVIESFEETYPHAIFYAIRGIDLHSWHKRVADKI